MTQRNSQAKRLYWKTLTPEQRSAIMSIRRIKGWAKIGKKARREHAMLMVRARREKKNNLSTA